MKITILDGHALNPGDLSWKSLEKFGILTVYDRTSPQEVISRIGDSEIVLLNKVCITEEIVSHCPNLRYIGVQATGFNVIDLEACKKHNIIVTNVPSYSTASVAQQVFAFISVFTNKIKLHSDSVKNGDWCKSQDFCYWKTPLIELEGKTLGIFGYGSIGRRVEKIANAYGMNVIVNSRTRYPEIRNFVSFDNLLTEADFITLHTPLTNETTGIINSSTLSKMKKSAYLINTARGALVNEIDLRNALENEIISGYASDVLIKEPMVQDCPLLNTKNCLITPHIAWAATETRQRLLNIVISNVEAFVNGKPQNVVN